MLDLKFMPPSKDTVCLLVVLGAILYYVYRLGYVLNQF